MSDLRDVAGMTEDDKLDEIIEGLTQSHLNWVGGYPYDWMWLDDTLVVAGLDAGKEYAATELRTYSRDVLLRKYDEAVAIAEAAGWSEVELGEVGL